MPPSGLQTRPNAAPRAGAGVSVWLAIALVIVSAGIVWLYYLLSPSGVEAEPPAAPFANVTDEWGVNFVHNNGATDEGLLPETMGSGVAIFDFDNDGWQDLLFVNSTYWPWEEQSGMNPTTSALYRNLGGGKFEDVTAGSGLDQSVYGMGVAVGDYDNDGWADVFLTTVGRNRLFRNVGGGRFEEATSLAGVGGADNEWSASAAWVDLNNDGWLDLFVCDYVRWGRELGIELAFKLAGIGRGYGPQIDFTGAYCDLYLNSGDGTFSDASGESGIEILDEETGFPKGRSLAVAPIDIDQDGWLDLVVANHNMRNFVFRNVEGARFEEIGGEAEGPTGAGGGRSMGIDVARLADEGLVGVAIGSFANELNRVYYTAGDSIVFAEEVLSDSNVATGSLQRFGLFFFDLDLDGRQDLLAVNGYLEEQINRIDSAENFRRSASLFWNSGSRLENRFAPMTEEQVGFDLFQAIVGRGAAYGDLDGDGDLDVVLTQNGGPAVVLRNESELGHNWMRIKLIGTDSNRDSIGARVEVVVGSRSLTGSVMPTRSYLSQSELPVTIGLGRATRVRHVTVMWPDGSSQTVEAPPINRELIIRQE